MATESTIRRVSTASLRLMLSACDTPVFSTEIVKVWPPVPASTEVSANDLVATRLTSSTIATDVVEFSAAFSSEAACAVLKTLGSDSVVVSTW